MASVETSKSDDNTESSAPVSSDTVRPDPSNTASDQPSQDRLDFADEDRQTARAYLRERFLRVMAWLGGHSASFRLVDGQTVPAEFGGLDIDFQEIFVRRLATPLGVQPTALLRASDVVSVTVDLVPEGVDAPATSTSVVAD